MAGRADIGAMLERALLWVVNARRQEIAALLWAFFYFFFLLGGYYLLRPIRDEMAIARGVENLKWLFLYTFIAMLVAAPLYGAVVARADKRRIIPIVYRFFALNIVGFYAFMLWTGNPALAGTAFFVWLSVFNLFVVSVFWSFLNDLFDSDQAKRLFPFITAGGSLGAIIGPLAVALLVKEIPRVHLLLLAAVMLEVALQCMKQVLRARAGHLQEHGRKEREDPEPRSRPIGGGVLDGARLVFRSPYFAGVALFFFLMTSAATFLYYTQAHFVRTASDDPAVRTQIFAIFEIVANGLTFVLQFFVAGRLFKRFGVGWGLVALPVIVLLGFGMMSLGPTLIMLACLQGVRRATQYALARPARENLFTPFGSEAKYKAKNFVDTAVYRGGDAASIWAFSGLRGAGIDFGPMALMMVPLAALWLFVALFLGRWHGRLTASHPPPGPVAEARR